MPTLRTLVSSTNVHQSPETSNFITEETGTASDHLHRRPVVSPSGPKGVDANVQRSMSAAQQLGIHRQEGKVLNNATPISCLSRRTSELSEHDNGSTARKLQDLQCEAQALKKREMCTIKEMSSILGRMTHVSKIGMETAPCTTGDCTDSSTSDPFTNMACWSGESRSF